MINFTIFNQLTAMPKRLAMVLTVLFTVGVGSMLGAVVSGTTYSTASSMPTGWSNNGSYNNSSYLKLTYSTNYIQTDDFCVNSFTSIKIKARKYGGPTDAQAKITIEWVVDGKATTLGTITPSSTSLTDYTISSPASITANKEGYVKISCKDASSDKGAGVSAVTITYTSGNCDGGGNTDGDSGDDSGDSGDGECVWERVTSIDQLTSGGTFIMGYEATAKSDVIVPLRSADCDATTSANGYFNTGTTTSSSTSGTITMSNISNTSDYEIYISSPTSGKINIQRATDAGNYYGSSSGGTSKNTGRLYTSGNSSETNIIVEWSSETNNQFKLSASVSDSYKYLKYNTSNPRFAFYNSEGGNVVFYKKVCESSDPTTYTVTYDKNGATSGSAPTDANSPYNKNASVTVLENTDNLAKTGYTFNGWNTQANGQGTDYSAGASFTIAADVTLYAQWKANTYKVSFNANEGTGTMTDQSFTYDEAKKALTTNAFTRTGYTFNGWNTQANGSGTSYADKAPVSNLTAENNATVTLYAQWKINTFTVTFNKNGGTGTMASQTFTYNVAHNLTTNSFSRKGYTFAGWNTQANGTGTAYTDQQSVTLTTSGLTLYAQWTPITYTVIFNPNGGYGTMENQVFTYDQAQHLTVNTFTRTGYTFNGWNNEDDGSGDSFTDEQEVNNLSSNKDFEYNLYAQWSGIVPIINTHPTSASYFWGESAEALSVEVSTQNVNHNYQWQSSLDNEQWYDIPDETNNSYLPSTETSGTTYYRVVVTNANADNCIATSNVATIIVRTPNCRWVEADITNLETGANVVISMNDPNGTFAMSNTEGTTSAPKAVGVSILNKSLENRPSEDIIWTLEKNNEGKLIFHPKNATSNLYCNAAQNNNDRVRVGTSSNAKINHKFEVDGSFLKNSITLHYIGLYYSNGSAQDWRGYAASSNFANQELKVYASDCLQPDEYWMNYNLSNVICAQPSPLKTKISVEEEGCELEFSANSGYQLPTEISVQMGNRELVLDDEYLWENGYLLILPNVDITGDITINILGCPLLETPVKNDPILTSTSATFSWVSVANAEKYEVTISDNNPSTEDIIRTTTETEITLDGLTKNTTYKWDIKPIAEDFCSNYSQEWVEFTTLDQFTVTFNANGHGTAPATLTVDAGSKITTPAAPTATGYTFGGWYKEANCTDAFDFNTPINADITLYAKWTPNVYTITFYKQYGNGGTDNATVTFNSNDYSVATIEAPTRDKYEFSGYYTGQQGAGVQVVDTEGKWLKNVAGYTDANGNWIKAENTHLYAKWTAIHTITWVVNNNTETPYHTSTVLSGSTIDQLPAPPADYLFADCDVNAFVGWSTDNIGFDPDPTAPTDLFKTVAEAQNKIGAISADKKFYAVYASASNGADSYKLATKVEDLFDGQTVIIAKDNGALERDNNTIDKVNISPDGNGNLSNVTDNIKWTLEASDTHWKLNNNGGYLGVTSTANQTAVSVTETNNVWQIAKSTASGDYFYICQPNTTIGLQYYNSRWQIYSNNSVSSSTNFTLKIYVPNVTNFITRCTALPDPVWGGATIDNAVIPVNCGSTTSNSHAAQISFPAANNYNLYKDITVEASSGFVLSTSRDAVEYQTSVTLSPTQSNTNAGTFANKYVYVRAVAPAQSDEDFTGTITISGKQIETQTINVTADVTCTQYTITFNDQGQTKEVQGFAGTSVEAPAPWVGICTEPIQYVFDGWAETPVANDTEEYEKIDFSAYTMPDNNTTVLHAVYRYAEDGGDPIEGFVKVTESLNDWTGDYVIVNEAAKKAIGNSYANTNTLTAVYVKISDNKVVEPTNEVIWQIRKSGENYTMYNAAASKYAYITGGESENAGLSDAVQHVNISWGSSAETARVIGSGDYSGRCFSYYTNGDEWRTYAASGNNVTGTLYKLSNKSLLYTSSLICGEISVEDDNVVVTSTKDQKVKVTVPIKVTSFYNDAVNVTGAGESTFSVATTENVAVNIDETTNIVLTYTPAEYDKLDNETITLTASNGATTTFQVKGRSLPESFAIVAKVGNMWYALPEVGYEAEKHATAYPVEVDNASDPTEVTSAIANNAAWSLRQVYQSSGSGDRYAAHGTNIVLKNNQDPAKALNASEKDSYLLTGAQFSNYHNSDHASRYEWTLSTEDLETYTLTNAERDKQISISKNAAFGLHASAVTNQVRFLPIIGTYKAIDIQVVEWYADKVLIRSNSAITAVTAEINGTTYTAEIASKDNALYEISNIPFAANPAQVVKLNFTVGDETLTKIIAVPVILSRVNLSTTDDLFSNITKDVYNYTDLVVRDGSVLTVNGTQAQNTFYDVTIYPTAKIVVPEKNKSNANNKLSVNSLTFIGGITEVYNGSSYELNKYAVPELSLKGTLGKTVTTMNYVMRVDLSQMYSLALPYDVALSDITYGDGSAIGLGTHLYVSAYDGAARAQNLGANKNWVYETDFATKFGSATLKAGVGYTISAEPQVQNDKYAILRLPMTKNINSGNSEAAKSVAVTAHGKDMDIADNHKGWNLVANPYMASINGDSDEYSELMLRYMEMLPGGTWQWAGEEQRYVTIPYNDGSGYYQLKFSEAVLQPFKNFFVQVGTSGTLDFVLTSRQNAPARYMQANTEREVEFEIMLGNELHQDNAGMLISDKYTPAYEINADLEKMTGSMSVFTIYNGYQLAYNALSPLNAEEQIPVGYIVPAQGEYTFDLKERGDYDEIEHIYLTDRETDAMVDLLEETYTFYTTDKKNNNRFAINVILKEESHNQATDLDNLDFYSKQPQKFLYDGRLYILRDGKVYSATGHEIKTINE